MPFEVWQPGMIITEERLAAISPTWQDWSPTWTTSTGNNTPSLGNAVVVARYAVAARTVSFELSVTFGTSTNFGAAPGQSDNWRFSLPVTAASTSLMIGYGGIQDASAGLPSRMPVRIRLEVTTALSLEMAGARIDAAAPTGPGLVDSLSPWTWANGDTLACFGEYEAAA
ncbi:hypothetical protein ACFWWC_03465 [Streptomyces sp. NPDC058642]|uniref:hypothetical protein n=1 Tax=Streptomyces sp. NPDC058642 TaxID=3346572 RepID=UPI003664A5BD